jgi:Fe-S oxidoreductase
MSAKYSDLSGYFQHKGRQFAEKCTNCGLCLEACPVFPLSRAAGVGAKVAITKVTDLLKGGAASDEAYEVVFSCNRGCGLCAKACPEGLMPYYLGFIPAAARLIEEGMPLPALTYQHLPGHRYNSGNFLSALQTKPSETRWMKRPPPAPEPAEVVFFTGCAPLGIPHVLLETIDIMDRMGIEFVTLAGGDLCCGMAATLWGDLKAAQHLGQELVSAIAAFHPKKAVFFCSGCYIMCLGTLPRFVAVPFQPYELTQFMLENVDRIPFKKAVGGRVAVHDSCHSARLGAVDAPRRLLQAVPGIELVEMAHHGPDALCCGGYTNSVCPDISESMRRAPMNEAEAAGADVLATICAGCHQSFAPLEADYPFQVRSFISLLAESVGIQREDRFKKYMRLASVPGIVSEAREYLAGSDFTVDEAERVLPDYVRRFCPGHGLAR